ncbi:MAG: hypothetical protein IPM53_20505 [Anaerolineaceae bacterium]|nr:hypothetical protein [Anaerolineaceae bacterium]
MSVSASFLSVLHQIHAALRERDILWAITGSTSFALRGLPFSPNDIDLQTDTPGAYAIEQALRPFVVQPVTFSSTARIRSHFGRLKVEGITVEIMGDMEKWVNGRWEPSPDISHHREFITVNGLELPVLSLAHEQEAYEKMGRRETAVILQQWLNKTTPLKDQNE